MVVEIPQHAIENRRLERAVRVGPLGEERVLVVRSVSGTEESQALKTPGVQRALTALLAACVHRDGEDEPIGAAAARALSSGERVRLALALAGVSSPDGRVPLRASCPAEGCGAGVERRVPVPRARRRLRRLENGLVRYALPESDAFALFRIPDGADQEAVEAFSSGSRRSGLSADPVLVRLLDRLLVRTEGEGLTSETSLWSDAERREAWEAIREAMGEPETEFSLHCSKCGHEFPHRFTPLGWLRDDPRSSEERLFAEVRTLARHQGWDEHTVLCLPRPRRLHYIALLSTSLRASRPNDEREVQG